MDEQLKKRLVGSLIFVSLAIVFFPLVFDGNEKDRTRYSEEMVDPPEFRLGLQSMENVKKKISDMERSSASKLPEELVDENDYSKKPNFSLDENNLPVNWSLQIGSFQKEQNAVGLRARLREQNFRSYILSGKSSTGDWYRVFVGPLSDRGALMEMKTEIKKTFGLQGNIVRHRVEQDADLFGG
ncbi:MAG: SPOR domain-containing protein [Pseudomonadota bacterium]|jgi:DedD protein|nr:SPOR domain-containing protein [Pseudomonadota bacterium]